MVADLINKFISAALGWNMLDFTPALQPAVCQNYRSALAEFRQSGKPTPKLYKVSIIADLNLTAPLRPLKNPGPAAKYWLLAGIFVSDLRTLDDTKPTPTKKQRKQ